MGSCLQVGLASTSCACVLGSSPDEHVKMGGGGCLFPRGLAGGDGGPGDAEAGSSEFSRRRRLWAIGQASIRTNMGNVSIDEGERRVRCAAAAIGGEREERE